MFILAHLAAGLIIGKASGSYAPSLIGALAVDVDHLVPYVKHKVFLSPRKLWKTITDPDDPYGNQRNFSHSFIFWAIISSVLTAVSFNAGLVFSIAYLSHLLLDLADGSDFYPFYPIKLNIRGPIAYMSKHEFLLTGLLFAIFVFI